MNRKEKDKPMIIIVNFNTALATTRQKICKNTELKNIINQ